MSTPQNIIDRWQKKGLTPTPQRVLIYEILAKSKNHPPAEEIWRQALKRYPALSLNTVYKALEAMTKALEVTVVETGGARARYEVTHEPHQHFHCRKCGRIIDLHISNIKPPVLPKKYRGELELHGFQINYFGYCEKCRAADKIPPKKKDKRKPPVGVMPLGTRLK